MLHAHLNRVYSSDYAIPIERDACAIDAVVLMNGDCDFRGQIVELSPVRIVMNTPGFGSHDINTYTGRADEMLPVLEAAYYNFVVRGDMVSVARLEKLLGERAARRAQFDDWRGQGVPWRALALGMPLGVENHVDMVVLWTFMRRGDICPGHLYEVFNIWQLNGGELFERLLERFPSKTAA